MTTEYQTIIEKLDAIQASVNAIGVGLPAGSTVDGLDDGKGNVVKVEFVTKRRPDMVFKDGGTPLLNQGTGVKASAVGARSFYGRYKIICLKGTVHINRIEVKGAQYGARFQEGPGTREFKKGTVIGTGQSAVVDAFYGPLPANFGGTHGFGYLVATAEHGVIINDNNSIVKV